MIYSDGAKEALKQSENRAVAFEMTPERKAKFSRIARKVVDLLKAETDGPIEACMILRFVQLGLEEMCGVAGTIIVNGKDGGVSA